MIIQTLALIALMLLIVFSYLWLSIQTFKELWTGFAISRVSWFQLWVNLHVGLSGLAFIYCFIATFTQINPSYFFLALAFGLIFCLAIVLDQKINQFNRTPKF